MKVVGGEGGLTLVRETCGFASLLNVVDGGGVGGGGEEEEEEEEE
ncbi:hypothetical protein L195_g006273 [Trifolium pratense]|uniref:Uncharacterized protein n=1 Tax=Trifolium pratense TaxID=57577 RepID=A0A2K3P344_TRIPR|nr:hypothetical protein L195_g006273 [Trifolium pratense]